ncbi:MAG: N-formylglutamate amidohydrolase [Rickettsiales bacterium]|jgi:predicted N-formylglutamate amidohydrolase|nr:N-formylglutamate amidohydrolase [Rickettsiales bacterium]
MIFEILNPSSAVPFLISAEHAGSKDPVGLGLSAGDMSSRVAYDLGARDIAERLAIRLGCAAVVAKCTRCCIDLNRELSSPTLFPVLRHGVRITSNMDLGPAERIRRIDGIWRPYHKAIDGMIAKTLGKRQVPIYISIHTCGAEHRQDMAFLFDNDRRMADYLKAVFAKEIPTLDIGMNEPYDAYEIKGTLSLHAAPLSLPCVEVEFNQRLIDNPILLGHAVETLAKGIESYGN